MKIGIKLDCLAVVLNRPLQISTLFECFSQVVESLLVVGGKLNCLSVVLDPSLVSHFIECFAKKMVLLYGVSFNSLVKALNYSLRISCAVQRNTQLDASLFAIGRNLDGLEVALNCTIDVLSCLVCLAQLNV